MRAAYRQFSRVFLPALMIGGMVTSLGACLSRSEPAAEKEADRKEAETGLAGSDELRSDSEHEQAAGVPSVMSRAPSPGRYGVRGPQIKAEKQAGELFSGSGDADAPNAATPPRRPAAQFGVLGQGGKGKPYDRSKKKARRKIAPPAPTVLGEGVLAVRPPGEQSPGDMYFRHYGVNPTIDTTEQPRSTFSVDVDTASYALTRSFLERGQLPAEAAVRVEEFINSFDYGYQAPTRDTFTVQAEAAPSPNRKGYHVLHLGVQGKTVTKDQRKAANLVFVVDISGSMGTDNRLGLVKRSLRLLVEQLSERDSVGIVAYGSDARVVLNPTTAHNKAAIRSAIDSLQTEGATNAEAGIRLAYKMAGKRLRKGAINRVVLCSDGVANTGLTTAGGILDTVHREAKRGITISAVGFGMGNYNDVLMEKLAQGGNGNYYYVDKLDQARRVFVENLTGTLQVIAKDVKIQVAFDPAAVARYRLIGYENRNLKARDFSNDRVDAGEIGAGHAVTAVYEVKLREGAVPADLGKVRIRYKAPTGGASQLIERGLSRSVVRDSADELSSPSQLSLAAAQFAEKLRGSYWARNIAYEDILGRFNHLASAMRTRADVAELRGLVEKAQKLDRRGDKFAKDAPIAMMSFDRVPVLR